MQRECCMSEIFSSLQRMAGSQMIFQVHTPFKSWVQGAQVGKSAPGVYWEFVLGCIIYIYGILGSMKMFFIIRSELTLSIS